MTLQRRVFWAACTLCAAACMLFVSTASADLFGTGANQFTIGFTTISAATNPTSGIPAGTNFTFTGVGYDYRMGVYEVTNDQWTKFKAELGIAVAGTPASAYDQEPTFTGINVPTNRVSWYEAAQFVNWLNTSTGHQAAYKFTGTQGASNYALGIWGAADAAGGTNLYRHKDAFYFLPTENEWVKAAYWNGAALQTYSNAAVDDLLGGVPDPAKWNYSPSTGSEPWTVGSGVMELNGTYDMMGNVSEWMESPRSGGNYLTTAERGLRGGSFSLIENSLRASTRTFNDPPGEDNDIGFRVASKVAVIPEPGTAAMLLATIACFLLRRRSNA